MYLSICSTVKPQILKKNGCTSSLAVPTIVPYVLLIQGLGFPLVVVNRKCIVAMHMRILSVQKPIYQYGQVILEYARSYGGVNRFMKFCVIRTTKTFFKTIDTEKHLVSYKIHQRTEGSFANVFLLRRGKPHSMV